jgi:hypothetical protein
VSDRSTTPGAHRVRSREGRRSHDTLTLLALLAIVFFALAGIGGPLLGIGVFAGTDELVTNEPYREAGLDNAPVQNTYMDDTYDTIIPNTLLYADALRNGEIAAWNPYILGGVPLGAAPNFALASPITIPYYLLPGWLAPAYVKLLEIGVAVTGCFLFLRRIGLHRSAALMGGLVFVSSAFLVAWTNWPQSRTAAVIPFVFWALERLVQQRRGSDAALLAAAVAAMLFGGFPAVTGHALLLAALYLLVRVLSEHRAGQWLRDVRLLAGGALGVVAGFALAAVQLLPFASFLSSSLVQGRSQTPDDHLAHEALITAIAPWALGTVEPSRPPRFALPVNLVESLSYVGAAALVLAAATVAMARAGRSLLPPGVWTFLVMSTLAGVLVVYGGGWPLALLQHLPILFSDNYVGRARSVLGFLVAVLAAVGINLLLRRDSSPVTGRKQWSGLVYAASFWLGLAAVAGWVWWEARQAARAAGADAAEGAERVENLDQHVLIGLAFLAVAALCAGVLRRAGTGRRSSGDRMQFLRLGAAVLLLVLIVGQSLLLVREYWPRSDEATFYPVTDVHRYLEDNLGHDRFAFARRAMATGADSPRRLRALNGHTFLNERFAETMQGLPGDQFFDPPTYPVIGGNFETATSPVLDRLAVRYFVMSPWRPVFGTADVGEGDGSTVSLLPGTPLTVPVPNDRPLRAVGLTPVATFDGSDVARVEVTLRDATGRVVASNDRSERGMAAGEPFMIPLAAEDLPDDASLMATFAVRADEPLVVEAQGSTAALSTVVAERDGLRLAYAGSSVVYERLTSLPRIRWASNTVVVPGAARRVELIAGGALDADQVVIDKAGPAADGLPADVRVVDDGLDEIAVEVDAAGSGYLVVADALQTGWEARVDGEPVDLVPADHGVVAVPVPPGEHTVGLHYASQNDYAGAWISGLTALALLSTVGMERWRAGRPTTGGTRGS